MAQTKATKEALVRDNFFCQYCLEVDHRVRHIFDDFVWGYPPEMAGGHHCAGRRSVDEPEMIIALCSEHHWKVENAKIKNAVMVAIASKIAGADLYHKYRQFFKWDDETWNQAINLVTQD